MYSGKRGDMETIQQDECSVPVNVRVPMVFIVSVGILGDGRKKHKYPPKKGPRFRDFPYVGRGTSNYPLKTGKFVTSSYTQKNAGIGIC